MATRLQFHEVTKKRDLFTLSLPGVSIEKGEILGVIGNNGAGKSTMIQLVLGLIQPTSGYIYRYTDKGAAASMQEWKQTVGFVFDDLSVYDDMDAMKLSSFMGEVYSGWDEAYFFSLLDQFDVDKKKKVKAFSRGMRMKTGIAVALAHHPEVLLLDEPTSGLDTKSRKQMIELLKEENEKQGTTIVFSSHILADMEQLATTVWLMDKGEILAHGPVEMLQENHSVSGDGTIHKRKPEETEGLKKATLEDLHDYYLGGGE
ncbi:ABC transporter ATP-binding protein [Salicibibacter halophilus]|uniref:ABC transporter ATP-binding protein n=1 Tax=Salicibibacter halophilus TaxID=2502791 RepID=A0A514LHB0_9BACI|nr:ABC transporter ATP-binding protein [Salicibibacter halophilus]QDI91234.1 ABC transporter ATP-binding protein [Salicibibacter halophilus]